MPEQYLSPYQVASQLGISVHTVRRWCTDFAQYLSSSASPVSGATSRLTPKDAELLQEVKRLRDTEGLTIAQINERLQGLVIPEPTSALEATPSPGQTPAALVVVESHAKRCGALGGPCGCLGSPAPTL